MVRIYEQVDVAAIDGTIAACSPTGEAAGVYNREVQESGTLGSGTNVITTNLNSNQRAMHFESEANEPNSTSWPTQTWTVRVNVTTGNSNITWEVVRICRVNSGGGGNDPVASGAPGLTMTAGVKTGTAVQGLAEAAAATDRFYIACEINRTSGHGNQSATITNDQLLDTGFPAGAPSATSAMTMLIPTMAATGVAAHVGTSAMNIPIPTMVASGKLGHFGTSAMTMLVPTMVSSGVVNAIIGTSAMTMLLPTLAAVGKLTYLGTSAMTMLLPTMVASGVAAHLGTSAITMLIPTMVASGTALSAPVIVCTAGIWSSTISFQPCDDFRITIDGPSANQVKVETSVEFVE